MIAPEVVAFATINSGVAGRKYNCTIMINGTGDYQIVLPAGQGIDKLECEPVLAADGTNIAVGIVHTSDTSKQILCTDSNTSPGFASPIDPTHLTITLKRVPRTA